VCHAVTSLTWPWARTPPVEADAGEAARHCWTAAVLYGGVIVWAVGFSLMAADRHRALISHKYDLGNMVQVVWSTAHGRFLENTATDGTQMSRLGTHVDPILALFAPLWWLWPSPEMLTTVQALALATGAVPVFWLARKHVGDPRAALCLALGYLLLPAVQWDALDDFHPVSLAVPLLLFCVWFLDEDRPVPAVLFGVLAGSTKEDIPLVLAGIAVWYAVRHRRWILGSTLAVLGVTWALIDLYVVIPHYSGSASPFYRRLESVGGSPRGVISTLVDDPSTIWHAVTTSADLRYLAALLVPLLLLPLLEPLLVLAATPVLALSLLSNFDSMISVRYHYASAPIACFVAAAAIGVRRLPRRAATLALVGVLVVSTIAASAGPLSSIGRYGVTARPSEAARDVAHRAMAFVPPDAAVSASNRIGAQLSERRRIFIFPVVAEADWVIVDQQDSITEAATQPAYRVAVDAILADSGWTHVFDEEGVHVLRRATGT
jgi:uncharacterized membrane protein